MGKSFDEANAQILTDTPGLMVKMVSKGMPITRDFNMNRVHVFVDDHNVVTRPPAVG